MFGKSLLSGAIMLCTLASPAQASAPLALTMPGALPLAAVGMTQIGCASSGLAGASGYAADYTAGPVSKSAAILGGKPSALELIRMQQGGGGGGLLPVAAPVAASFADTSTRYAPALPVAAIGFACPGLQQGNVLRAPTPPPARSTGAFLGSERIAILHTRYDADWRRVEARTLSRADLTRAIGALPADRPENRYALLSRVNRWVNRKIDYRDDRQLFGASDYWADAASTLARGAGDCEDFAILKMQLLAAAGINREDMMLTLARDTMRRVDHAVLLVRDGERWMMLDLQSDRVVPADGDYGYRAVLSFSTTQRWLHGQAVTPPQPAIRLAYN